MSRHPSYPNLAYAFGPGPMGPAVKWLILTNVVTFVLTAFIIALLPLFGLLPVAVIEHYRVWQLVTYMFLHAGLFHIIFNMLALWMFGVELERLWGARQFLTYYFVAGAGAAFVTVAVSLLPFDFSSRIYFAETIGASGAIYGVLLAYGLRFPDRPIYMYLLFPIPAKYFVLILGAISFFVSVTDPRSGVAHATHLGGLVVGYLYLKGGGGGLTAEIKYRYLKWKMNRLRRKFDVYSGGRNDWNRHQH